MVCACTHTTAFACVSELISSSIKMSITVHKLTELSSFVVWLPNVTAADTGWICFDDWLPLWDSSCWSNLLSHPGTSRLTPGHSILAYAMAIGICQGSHMCAICTPSVWPSCDLNAGPPKLEGNSSASILLRWSPTLYTKNGKTFTNGCLLKFFIRCICLCLSFSHLSE